MALARIDFTKIGQPPTYIDWLKSLPDNHRFAMLASHLMRLKVTESNNISINVELINRRLISDILQSELLISGYFYNDFLKQAGFI